MMFLMRILESLLAGGVMVAALAVWRLCSPSSSRSWRAVAWVVAAFAVFGVTGFYWTAALKVSLRTALGDDALVNAASAGLQTVSSLAQSTKARDELSFEYRLQSADGKVECGPKTERRTAKADGEDPLTPAVKHAAEAIVAATVPRQSQASAQATKER